MTEEELKDRVRILARRVVLGEADLAVAKLLTEIDDRLAKSVKTEVDVHLKIHVGTLMALARSSDIQTMLDPDNVDVPAGLEGSE